MTATAWLQPPFEQGQQTLFTMLHSFNTSDILHLQSTRATSDISNKRGLPETFGSGAGQPAPAAFSWQNFAIPEVRDI
jgi:hypothetical protein